ncbi:MAG: glycosyltransferase family 1 protein [Sphingobacteriaceae bacterium]|nr:MAG: glycosyltransferase family 1 protein [Sphingobacteriaceae bacterium]
MKKKILFVSHDASRTGAPIVFKYLIQWVKNTTTFDFLILFKNTDGQKGAIIDDFSNLGNTLTWPQNSHKKTFFGKIWKKLTFKPLKLIPTVIKNSKFDLIYLNTVDSVYLLPALKTFHQCPVILHVHEGEWAINSFFAETLDSNHTQYIDRYIAVSESTKKNLIENFSIPAEKIVLINEFVPVKMIPAPTGQLNVIQTKLKSAGDFIVGGSGTADWRKGIDLFIQVAAIVKRTGKKVKFIWVGSVDNHVQHQLNYELKRMALTDADILFTGSVSNPQDYFSMFDIFVLTSREDPFPLVCLEAAGLGKPVICFADAGGMPEMVSNGGGIIVPYINTQAMAQAIISLKDDPEKLNRLSAEAKTVVQEYDVSVQAPKIIEVINTLIN